jgi:hypothetical protein
MNNNTTPKLRYCCYIILFFFDTIIMLFATVPKTVTSKGLFFTVTPAHRLTNEPQVNRLTRPTFKTGEPPSGGQPFSYFWHASSIHWENICYQPEPPSKAYQ